MIRFPSAALLVVAALLATAAVPSAARVRYDVPPATPTGPPVSCVAIRNLGDSRVRNDRVIDFVGTGKRAYRVTLPQACPGLGLERSFSYRTSLSQLCSQDIITVLHQGAGLLPGASCGLAVFQPIRLSDPRR